VSLRQAAEARTQVHVHRPVNLTAPAHRSCRWACWRNFTATRCTGHNNTNTSAAHYTHKRNLVDARSRRPLYVVSRATGSVCVLPVR
jgi:hypothetical protein